MIVSTHTYRSRPFAFRPNRKTMLYEKYYKVAARILNENLFHEKFNYSRLMDYANYIYHVPFKKSNLEKFVSYPKKWKFLEYKQGGSNPFTMIREIPYSLVGEICRNNYMTSEQREEMVKEHYMMQRKGKILKLREKIERK